MKIDTEAILMGLDGKELKDGNALVTFKTVVLNALLASFPDEQDLSGDEKFKRYRLATRISDANEIDLSVEDAALIKKLIGKGFGPLIVGRVFDLIEKV